MEVKIFMLITILLTFAMSAFASAGSKDYLKNNNDFANKILKEEIKSANGQNVVISPMSLNMALSIVSNGANGKTLTEFGKLLQNGAYDQKELNAYNKDLISNSKQLKVENYSIANSVWIRGNYNKSFVDLCKNYYNADVQTLNTNSAGDINSWVSGKTNGKITQMLDRVNPLDRAYIVNAVYFYAKWEKTFPLFKTSDRAFNCEDGKIINTKFMQDEGSYNVVKYKNGTILKKPCIGEASMYFMLPDKGVKVADFVKNINFNEIIAKDSSGKDETWKIIVPKFKVECSKDLNNDLKSLGLSSAFDPETADFSKISKDTLYISRVLQKTYIGVDEKGTEAAAATSIGMAGMSMPKPTPEIIFDRPFAFAIVDELNKIVIFTGVIYNPSK